MQNKPGAIFLRLRLAAAGKGNGHHSSHMEARTHIGRGTGCGHEGAGKAGDKQQTARHEQAAQGLTAGKIRVG